MSNYLDILWLYIPALIANGIPVVVAKTPLIHSWNKPISESIFGKNKTWRGLLFGTSIAILVSVLFISEFDTTTKKIVWGGLLGTGALGGDLIESFIKRKMGLAPGKALPFFDGVDYMVGAILLGLFLHIPDWKSVIFLLLIGPLLSLLANVIAYFLGLKNVWY